MGRTSINPVQKSAPEELLVILLFPGWVTVGSRAELPVCGGAFQLGGPDLNRNATGRGLRDEATAVPQIRRSRGSGDRILGFAAAALLLGQIECFQSSQRRPN